MDNDDDIDPIKLTNIVDSQIADELRKKGRVPPQLIVVKEKLEIFNEMAELVKTTSPSYIYAIKNKRELAIEEKKSLLRSLSKIDLIDRLARLEVRNEALEFISNLDDKVIARLLSEVNKFYALKIKVSESKTIGRAKLYEKNRKALEDVLIKFEIKYQRKISLNDYSLYERLVFELYPKPPYIPERKVYRKKEMTSDQIAEEKKNFKRTTWSKGYIRSFFEEKLGGKVIKMNKKSPLK